MQCLIKRVHSIILKFRKAHITSINAEKNWKVILQHFIKLTYNRWIGMGFVYRTLIFCMSINVSTCNTYVYITHLSVQLLPHISIAKHKYHCLDSAVRSSFIFIVPKLIAFATICIQNVIAHHMYYNNLHLFNDTNSNCQFWLHYVIKHVMS